MVTTAENPLESVVTNDYIWTKYVGTFGAFQKWLTLYMWFIIGPLTAFNVTTQLLILVVPPHWCADPTDNSENITDDSDWHPPDWIPQRDIRSDFEACRMVSYITHDNKSAQSLCPFRWEYDFKAVYATPVSENNWVCDESWKVYFVHALYWASSALGVILFGILSDSSGRIAATKLSFLLTAVAGISTVFASRNFYWFLFFRILMGLTAYAGLIPLVLVTEYVDVKKRLMVSMGYFSFLSLTNGILPWLAYSIGKWRLLSLITSASMLVVPVMSKYIPESVRWLMATGRVYEARKNIELVARFNGQVVSGYILDNIEFFTKPAEPFRRVFSYRRFMKLFYLTCLMWMLISLVFVGSNIYCATLSSRPFFMITVNSLIDVAGTVIAWHLADKFGRKSVTSLNSFICAVLYFATSFFSAEEKNFLVSFFVARFFLMMVFNVKLLYAAELYPTVIRNRAISIRMAVGSIGGFIGPLIIMKRYWDTSVCLLIFSVSMAMAGGIMIFLPETKGKPLPQTLEDTENE